MPNLVFLEPNKITAEPNGSAYPMSYIYVIEQKDRYCKIGTSIKPDQRMRTLETQGGFKSQNYYRSIPISNGYEVESMIHALLSEQRAIGEWFVVPYTDAVEIANKCINAHGNKSVKHMNPVTFDFWSLPENYTKWFFEDAPEIYDWFISHGYSVYHDHTRNEVMVRSEDEEFEDIPFAFFAAITINADKLLIGKLAGVMV